MWGTDSETLGGRYIKRENLWLCWWESVKELEKPL